MDLRELNLDAALMRAKLTDVKACLCGKQIREAENVVRWYSGLVNYSETLCPECRKVFRAHARIVCLGCRRLQGFMEPQQAKTGFVFRGSTHYHIQRCPSCDPKIVSTPVLEHEAFCRDQKLVTRRDMDLVQEIEQKTLQGVAEADKLRRDITRTHA